MLKSHMDAMESHLLAISKIPTNAGHPLHKGTPREAFIKEFLSNHLSERVSIGTGEIIEASSKPRESRNQIDIVIYKRDYPKLDFGGGISGFLAESVVATIEVKSILDKAAFSQCIDTARKIKALQRNIVQVFTAGYHPPAILNYVVAYDGPAKMQTIADWIPEIYSDYSLSNPVLPIPDDKRVNISSTSIDAVFVLGRGFLYFDNVPSGFVVEDIRQQHPDMKWAFADSPDGNLLILFVFLTQAVSGVSGSWWDPLPYLRTFQIDRVYMT